jgi:hypothetical protein
MGCLFIGTPQSMRMPPDFYFEKGDRKPPLEGEIYMHPVQRDRVAVDSFRRLLTQRVAWLSAIASLAICFAGYSVLGTGSWVKRQFNQHKAHAEQCAQAAQLGIHPTDCQ